MKLITPSLLVLLFLLPACKESPRADSSSTPPPAAPAPPPANAPVEAPAKEVPPAPAPAPEPAPAPAPAPAAVDMDAAISTLMAKPEHTAASVEVQHILIAFQGTGIPTATRSKDEAKALAQKVYAEAMGGSDFGELVKQHTNDAAPGIYPMTAAGRNRMVQGFGDVGWRLQVGEIGVAPYDPKASPYGWHIIKRLK